ncbi:hypothetical protein [Microbacterium plantarum]|nr:hypothetical protein [Microbacterium plantarum]WRK16539.1 hypothetical protein VC184_11535 [Microbacterium plantarum]
MNADIPCPGCNGEGATYTQVRIGQFSTPFVCGMCDGDGSISEAGHA